MTVRRNRAGREIWFQRGLWGGIPCHWKGWALIAGVAALANGAYWLLNWISGAMNKPNVIWPYLVILPFMMFVWWLAERHTS
jgi:hypothetical protein